MKRSLLVGAVMVMVLFLSSCTFLSRGQHEQLENRAKELLIRAKINKAALEGEDYVRFKEYLVQTDGIDLDVVRVARELERLIKLNTELEELVAVGIDKCINGPEGSPEISGQ